MSVSSTNSSASNLAALAAASSTTAGGTATTAATTANQFLTLLVAQMQNQDPLNPMDNAAVTTQMAQIQTVQGVATLNTTMQGLGTQLSQMQAIQASSLVGKEVIVPGNQLAITNGVGTGGFSLASAATNVAVNIVSPAGQIVSTMNLGAQSAGTSSFNWPAGNYTDASGLKFTVTATNGATPVTSTALMQDTVDAVNTSGSTLTLQLQNSGSVPYTTVQALN